MPYWLVPTASTFMLNNTSYRNVENMNGDVIFPRGASDQRKLGHNGYCHLLHFDIDNQYSQSHHFDIEN